MQHTQIYYYIRHRALPFASLCFLSPPRGCFFRHIQPICSELPGASRSSPSCPVSTLYSDTLSVRIWIWPGAAIPHHGCAHHGWNTSRSSASPSEARTRAKRGSRRRRPAPKALPSLARASNESWDATELEANKHGANKHPAVGGKACSARTGYMYVLAHMPSGKSRS